MTSLRMRVVEAGARALQPGLWTLILDDPNEEDPPGIRERSLRKGERALDAMLDCLSENTDEWVDERYPEAHRDVNVVRIIADHLVEALMGADDHPLLRKGKNDGRT